MPLIDGIRKQAQIQGYDITPEGRDEASARHIGRLESMAGTTKLTGQELSSLTNGASYEDVSSMLDRPWNPLHEDIPYIMAENQSVGAKIGGFANQLQGEIIGGAIEGFGYLGDVAHWGDRLSGGEGDWGNWLSDVGTSYKDLTRDLTPIYQHHPGEAFDPGDFGWWMSNAVSVGSSLSLLIPAAGATMALGKLGKLTGMLDKAVKLGSKLGLAAESTQMLGTVMGRAMFSRHMENMMEANGTYDEIYNKQKQLGKSDEEATRLASGGAADVYKYNWPLVIQDIAQMALIAKGPNFTKAVDSAAVATAAGMSAKGALLKAGYTKGWDMLTEGAEEAYQFVVGEEAKYSVDVATGLKPKSNFGDRLGEYAKDGHLWTSAMFGALGAGVMQAAGPLVNKLTSGEYNPETAARVEEIKTRGVTYAAASKLYREAANADSKEGIEHASDFMALDLVTRAEATGNLDLQFKQLDDFKTMSKEERAAENFDEGMVERIDDIKSRMQEIVEMSKNIRKTHDPLVRYNVAMRMLQNKRYNKTLQESKVNESVNTNAIPRHSDLSSFGKSSLNDILDLKAINSSIAATSQMLQGNITDFVKSKLEQTLKDYEAKRDVITAKLDSEEANTNITEEDLKIIDSYQNSPFVDKVIVDKVKTIIAKDAIDRNNEEIAHLGSKEGIEDYKRVVAKARKQKADKDAKDAQDKLDAENAAADALVKAKSKEEELSKLTTELTPSDEELLKSMPENHLIGKTDTELQAIADQEGYELSDVKGWQQADIEAFNKLKEEAANTAKTKAKEKLAEASKTNDEFIPTADNTTQIDFTESLPERESPKITTGHALAWKSSGNAISSELDKFNNKELSNFLEDPNIDLSAYDVVFSIDEEKLEKESNYEGVAEQLAAGNFENIGEVPVKGVFHLNGVPVLSPSGKPYTVYIHDSTYEYFADQYKEDAIAEVIALKTAVVAAKPGTTISTKIVNKSKGHLNVDKQGNKFIFHSLVESINDKSDKLEFAVGGNGGIYLNTAENKDIHNSLVGLLSARPGAVYTLVKTANGKVVPIRTWVSKLDEQEATLLYNTYKDILNKPQEYQNKLSKEFKEANASILTSLPINTATITYKELLEFFVFEGALTKDMGGRQLYTTKDGTLHIAGEVIDVQTMNTPEGMIKFVNLITAGNFRQISRTRLADNSYKAYVSKNNILTTNVVKVNNNIFVQPTLTIGTLETKSTSVEQQSEVVSDSKADIEKQISELENVVNSEEFATTDLLKKHWQTRKYLLTNKIKQLRQLLKEGIKTGEDVYKATILLNDIRGTLNEGIDLNKTEYLKSLELKFRELAKNIESTFSKNLIQEYINYMNDKIKSRGMSIEKNLVQYSGLNSYTLDGKNEEYFLININKSKDALEGSQSTQAGSVVGGDVNNIKNKQLKNSQGDINTGNIEVVKNIPTVHKVIGKDKNGNDIKVVINGDKLKGTLISKNGNYLFKAMQGRIFTLAKVGDFYLPFYISSAGTSGKIAGEWYPFFGYNNWLVKGRVGTKGEMEYSQKISDVQKLLNDNFILPASYLSADNKVAIGEQFVPAKDDKGNIIREGKYNFEKMIPNKDRKVLYDLSEDIDIITHHHQEEKGETKLNEHDWVAEKTGFNPKNVVNDGGNSADNWINDIIALTENVEKASKGVITKAVEQSIKETPPQSIEDVRSKIEELKSKLAKARSIKSKAKIQEELDALETLKTTTSQQSTQQPVTQPVVQPVDTVTRDFADSLFPEATNLNDNQITKAKMRILWNANTDIIIKKWGVESFDKFYNLAKLDPKVTEWTINNCK
tara:strand:+ start:145 stop:5553 length:5409 start_codon:yes stop_codon:yes gene_type:complete